MYRAVRRFGGKAVDMAEISEINEIRGGYYQ